jgi:hypothetical protein
MMMHGRFIAIDLKYAIHEFNASFFFVLGLTRRGKPGNFNQGKIENRKNCAALTVKRTSQ